MTRGAAELLTMLDQATIAEGTRRRAGSVRQGRGECAYVPARRPIVPNARETKRRERWLEQRRGIGELLLGIGK